MSASVERRRARTRTSLSGHGKTTHNPPLHPRPPTDHHPKPTEIVQKRPPQTRPGLPVASHTAAGPTRRPGLQAKRAPVCQQQEVMGPATRWVEAGAPTPTDPQNDHSTRPQHIRRQYQAAGSWRATAIHGDLVGEKIPRWERKRDAGLYLGEMWLYDVCSCLLVCGTARRVCQTGRK